jgi:hypothetical protein
LIFRVLAESVDAILTDSRSVFVAVDAAVWMDVRRTWILLLRPRWANAPIKSTNWGNVNLPLDPNSVNITCIKRGATGFCSNFGIRVKSSASKYPLYPLASPRPSQSSSLKRVHSEQTCFLESPEMLSNRNN